MIYDFWGWCGSDHLQPLTLFRVSALSGFSPYNNVSFGEQRLLVNSTHRVSVPDSERLKTTYHGGFTDSSSSSSLFWKLLTSSSRVFILNLFCTPFSLHWLLLKPYVSQNSYSVGFLPLGWQTAGFSYMPCSRCSKDIHMLCLRRVGRSYLGLGGSASLGLLRWDCGMVGLGSDRLLCLELGWWFGWDSLA